MTLIVKICILLAALGASPTFSYRFPPGYLEEKSNLPKENGTRRLECDLSFVWKEECKRSQMDAVPGLTDAPPRNDTNKVIGGFRAREQDAPFAVYLETYYIYPNETSRIYSCTGVILSSTTVATAAHCLTHSGQLEKIIIIAGTVDMRFYDTQDFFFAYQFAVHPQYRLLFSWQLYDVGVIFVHRDKVTRIFRFRDTVQEIPEISLTHGTLYQNFLTGVEYDNCFIFGWGVTEAGDVSSEMCGLRKQLLEDGNCECLLELYGAFYPPGGSDGNRITNNGGFCSANIFGYGHETIGDSGGPVLCYVDHNGVPNSKIVLGTHSALVPIVLPGLVPLEIGLHVGVKTLDEWRAWAGQPPPTTTHVPHHTRFPDELRSGQIDVRGHRNICRLIYTFLTCLIHIFISQ